MKFFLQNIPSKIQTLHLLQQINPMEDLIWKFGYKASFAFWPGLPFPSSRVLTKGVLTQDKPARAQHVCEQQSSFSSSKNPSKEDISLHAAIFGPQMDSVSSNKHTQHAAARCPPEVLAQPHCFTKCFRETVTHHKFSFPGLLHVLIRIFYPF